MVSGGGKNCCLNTLPSSTTNHRGFQICGKVYSLFHNLLPNFCYNFNWTSNLIAFLTRQCFLIIKSRVKYIKCFGVSQVLHVIRHYSIQSFT